MQQHNNNNNSSSSSSSSNNKDTRDAPRIPLITGTEALVEDSYNTFTNGDSGYQQQCNGSGRRLSQNEQQGTKSQRQQTQPTIVGMSLSPPTSPTSSSSSTSFNNINGNSDRVYGSGDLTPITPGSHRHEGSSEYPAEYDVSVRREEEEDDEDEEEQRVDMVLDVAEAEKGMGEPEESLPLSMEHHDTEIKRLSIVNILLITICFSGLQFGWALQIALLTPFMLELGLPKPLVTVVWLCGPIAGLFVQPIVGALSDRCTSKLGKRRPFILAGGLFITLALFLIPNSLDLGHWLGDNPQVPGQNPFALALAVIGFWILDISNNMMQGPCRALIADMAPPEQQNTGYAIFSAWLALGNISGYLMGFFPFNNIGFLKWTSTEACREGCQNLRICFMVGTVFLTTTTAVTLFSAKEKQYKPAPRPNSENMTTMERIKNSSFAHLFIRLYTLPKPMVRICLVQFFNWFGWFTFLIYITNWMGENVFHGDPNAPRGSIYYDNFHKGVRWGSAGLAGFAFVSLIFSPIVPKMVDLFGSRVVWMFGNICLAASLGATCLVGDRWTGMLLISSFGISWSVTMTVPFSLTAKVAPEEEKGVYMGILNIFVVLPQLVMSGFGSVISVLFNGNVVFAFMAGSIAAIVSCVLVLFVITDPIKIQQHIETKGARLLAEEKDGESDQDVQGLEFTEGEQEDGVHETGTINVVHERQPLVV